MLNAKEQMAKAKAQAAKLGLTKTNAQTAGSAMYDGLKAIGRDCRDYPMATAAAVVVGFTLDGVAEDISTMADASAMSAYVDINEYYGS